MELLELTYHAPQRKTKIIFIEEDDYDFWPGDRAKKKVVYDLDGFPIWQPETLDLDW